MNSFKPAGRLARWTLAGLFALVGLLPAGLSAGPAKTFQNPILSGFYPDPSICRVGDDYYLVNSSFEFFPGVPIFHSRDLVHWRQLGYCLTRKSQLNLDHARASGGIYAPTLRYHNGTFYLITTLVDKGGNFFVTATNPAGPWSEPVWVDHSGIDPSLFFDEDGTVYYDRHEGLGDGFIGQAKINVQTGQLDRDLKEVWRGTGGVLHRSEARAKAAAPRHSEDGLSGTYKQMLRTTARQAGSQFHFATALRRICSFFSSNPA